MSSVGSFAQSVNTGWKAKFQSRVALRAIKRAETALDELRNGQTEVRVVPGGNALTREWDEQAGRFYIVEKARGRRTVDDEGQTMRTWAQEQAVTVTMEALKAADVLDNTCSTLELGDPGSFILECLAAEVVED